MKKYIKPICLLLIIVAGIVSSCQEENVEPASGNQTSTDDWQKHNV